MPVRRLAHMLRLDQDEHQAYSWCCGATANCPMALAAVDPGVVPLDFDCVPPDRFHGVVDMVNDMFDVVRARLEKHHIAQVGVTCSPALALCRPWSTGSKARRATRSTGGTSRGS